jgi:hypothetical protein
VAAGETTTAPQPPQASAAVRSLLDGAVAFAFKAHQFAGGFDASCARALDEVAALWRAIT